MDCNKNLENKVLKGGATAFNDTFLGGLYTEYDSNTSTTTFGAKFNAKHNNWILNSYAKNLNKLENLTTGVLIGKIHDKDAFFLRFSGERAKGPFSLCHYFKNPTFNWTRKVNDTTFGFEVVFL